MADIQTEKAFKKQDGLNLYNKYLLYGEEVPTKTVVKKKKDQAKSFLIISKKAFTEKR